MDKLTWKYFASKKDIGDVGVTIIIDDDPMRRIERLKHCIKHSPTGLQIGYAGSDPADTARSILIDYFKRIGWREKNAIEQAEKIYQNFKCDFIEKATEELNITSEMIDNWVVSPLQKMFDKLKKQWKDETVNLSSIQAIATHIAYQQIIGMGPVALPLILRELEKALDHWFWALRAITGENPVPQEEAGNMERMRELWINWGQEKGFLRKPVEEQA